MSNFERPFIRTFCVYNATKHDVGGSLISLEWPSLIGLIFVLWWNCVSTSICTIGIVGAIGFA